MTDSVDRDYWTKGLSSEAGDCGPGHYLTLVVATLYLGVFLLLSRAFGLLIRPARRRPEDGLSILAIGPFFSQNWTAAHMDALGKADVVERVSVVTPDAYEAVGGREYVVYSKGIARFLGAGVARAVSAFWFAVRRRPDMIIGYHLPWNGVMALLLGRISGAKVWYFSVGGPAELLGGGRYSEHALFSRLCKDSRFVENRLVSVVNQFDGILTMGSKSATFFRALVTHDRVFPIAVGIDAGKFASPNGTDAATEKRFDLVTVGRHSRIKRVDVLLEAVACAKSDGLAASLVLVGDGHERAALEQLSEVLGIADKVHFAGWVDDVASYVHQSKVLVMTSASEGLPHSVIESMMAGLPAIVSDVGEISDLVDHGQNGFLVTPGCTQEFAARISELLTTPGLLDSYGKTAAERALRYSVDGRRKIWNDILGKV